MKCKSCSKEMILLNTEISPRIYLKKWYCKNCRLSELEIRNNDGSLMR